MSVMFLKAYLPYCIISTATYRGTSSEKVTNQMVLQYLDELINFPLIGQFFYEDKIYKLVDM